MPSFAGFRNRVVNALKFGRHNHRSVFQRIFDDRYRGDEESVSGIGSRMVQSNIDMMLVTTHTDSAIVNRDIWTGDFRLLDLFKPPFSLPIAIVRDHFPDFADPLPPREMILLRREDLAQALRKRSW